MRILILSVLFISFSAFAGSDSDDFSFGSNSFKDGETLAMKYVFNSFGCKGNNVYPELHWSNLPSKTESLAITVYDPDAPTGSGWWHWTVFNIPKNITSLKEGEKYKPFKSGEMMMTFGKTGEGRTDFGKPGYGGPCPPVGDKPHRYIITLYAIKEAKLPLNKDSSGAMVGYTINANTIEKLSITAMFGRSEATK